MYRFNRTVFRRHFPFSKYEGNKILKVLRHPKSPYICIHSPIVKYKRITVFIFYYVISGDYVASFSARVSYERHYESICPYRGIDRDS